MVPHCTADCSTVGTRVSLYLYHYTVRGPDSGNKAARRKVLFCVGASVSKKSGQHDWDKSNHEWSRLEEGSQEVKSLCTGPVVINVPSKSRSFCFCVRSQTL